MHRTSSFVSLFFPSHSSSRLTNASNPSICWVPAWATPVNDRLAQIPVFCFHQVQGSLMSLPPIPSQWLLRSCFEQNTRSSRNVDATVPQARVVEGWMIDPEHCTIWEYIRGFEKRTHVREDILSKAFPTVLSLLSYRSSSSSCVSSPKISESRCDKAFCLRHSFLRCLAKRSSRRLTKELNRECTSSNS